MCNCNHRYLLIDKVQHVNLKFKDDKAGNVRTVELHLYGVTGTASHPDTQQIRIIGFFFENRPHWQSEVQKISSDGYFNLRICLRKNKTLIHNSLYVFNDWGKNLSPPKIAVQLQEENN
jgi:hypothetical protein